MRQEEVPSLIITGTNKNTKIIITKMMRAVYIHILSTAISITRGLEVTAIKILTPKNLNIIKMRPTTNQLIQSLIINNLEGQAVLIITIRKVNRISALQEEVDRKIHRTTVAQTQDHTELCQGIVRRINITRMEITTEEVGRNKNNKNIIIMRIAINMDMKFPKRNKHQIKRK